MIAKASGFLLKIAFSILVFTLLLFMITSIPLGFWLLFFVGISRVYTFKSNFVVEFLNLRFEVNIGFLFTIFSLIYVLCFLASFRKSLVFKDFKKVFKEEAIFLLIKDPLFAASFLPCSAYVMSKLVHLIEESYGIPVGQVPVSADPLIALLQLLISPLLEETLFRILPIGVFSATYFLNSTKLSEIYTSWRKKMKLLFLIFISPESGKRIAHLKTITEYGFLRGINSSEWLMVTFTSALFSLSHYTPPTTWGSGKILSVFIQGLIMGLAYLAYGFQAPIIIHWFLNYYLYTSNLASYICAHLSFLSELNIYTITILGALSLTIVILVEIRSAMKSHFLNTKILFKFYSVAEDKIRTIYEGMLRKFKGVNLKSLRSFNFAALLLILLFIAIRFLIVNFPGPDLGERYYETGFVFDEVYYVKAARMLLKGESTNHEHPPFVKILIMVGITVFGDNPLGWRFFSILLSSTSVGLLYLLTLSLTRNQFTSFSASLLFAFDMMAFNIGQIGMLDGVTLMFVLAASIMLVKEKYDSSGLLFGLALLCKLSSIFSLGIILFLLAKEVFEDRRLKMKTISKWFTLSMRIILMALVILLVGLWVYDVIYGVFSGNPFNHLNYMLSYHSVLQYDDPEKVILPLRWINPLNPFPPIPYYVAKAIEVVNGEFQEYYPIAYYGIYTPLWWSIWFIMPVSSIEIARRKRSTDLFIFLWIATNFLPYVILAYVSRRWVYPFYFCMTLPGLYIGISQYLNLGKLRMLLILLISIQILWFILWFPIKPKLF